MVESAKRLPDLLQLPEETELGIEFGTEYLQSDALKGKNSLVQLESLIHSGRVGTVLIALNAFSHKEALKLATFVRGKRNGVFFLSRVNIICFSVVFSLLPLHAPCMQRARPPALSG